MANKNFIVQNGLTVGAVSIDATSGNITTTGTFVATGAAPASFTSINNTPIGNVTPSTAAFTTTTTGSLQAAAIGNVTPGTGAFTTTTTGGLQAAAIGNVAPGTGAFTTVSASGVTNITNSTASTSTSTGALVVAGGAGIGGDLRVGGTLFVSNLQATSSTQISVQDPMLYLTANVLYPWNYDTGLFSDSIGGSANTYVHHGMVRNYSSAEWTFFSNVKSEPGGTVNWSDAGLVYDTIKTGHHLPGANLSYNLGSTTAWWGTLYGVSTQAKYADLAENYQADNDYAPGQVLMFGGDQEVTIAAADTKAVAGVVSTNPAHLMNGQLRGSRVVALALQGRVPCNVIGPITKGDLLVSAGFGYAKSNNQAQVGQVIGKALETFHGSKGVIEVVVGRV